MATKTEQMRYIADGDSRNYPPNLNGAMLTSGAMFDSTTRIKEITIQGQLDLAFYINDTITPIRIAPSSLQQEDIQKWSSTEVPYVADIPIYSVRFDAQSLAKFLEANSHREEGDLNYLFITYTREIPE